VQLGRCGADAPFGASLYLSKRGWLPFPETSCSRGSRP
jgi:hypothetical protein